MTVDWYQVYTKSLIVDAAQTAQLLLTRNSLSLLQLGDRPDIDFNDPSVADVDSMDRASASSRPISPA